MFPDQRAEQQVMTSGLFFCFFACFYVSLKSSEYIQKIVVKDIINVCRFKQNEGIE